MIRQPRRLIAVLERRWRDLSIRAKLGYSLIGVSLLAVFLVVFFAQAFVRNSVIQAARTSQETRVTQAISTFEKSLTAIEQSLVGVSQQLTGPVNDYMAALNETSFQANREFKAVVMNTALLNQVLAGADLYEEARIVDLSGQQIARVFRGSRSSIFNVVPPADLKSEGDRLYFKQLSQLRPNSVYLTQIGSVAGTQPNSSEVVFEYGIPIAQGENKTSGYLILSVRVTPIMTALVGSETQDSQTDVYLIDDTKQVLASLVSGSRYLFDNRFRAFDLQIAPKFFEDQGVTFVEDATRSLNGQVTERYISSRAVPIRTTLGLQTWHMLIMDSNESLLAPVDRLRFAIILPVLFAFGLLIFATNFISQQITGSLRQISEAARRMASGDVDVAIPVTGHDEIGQVSASLNSMAQQTSLLISTLEERVQSRTKDIQSTAEISRDLSGLRDLDELLQRTVDTLRDRFGFYHVQVFLVDDKREFAVLRSSTGEAGRQLLARNHKLAVGSFSIIGQVTDKDRPFVTLDTQSSEVPHKFNPLLPNTRSEMALPMRAGTRLIGALDVQSEKANAFDQSTVGVFQVLADQLAAAIENTLLLNRSRDTAEQVEQLNRQLTRDSWETYIGTHSGSLAYRYDMTDVAPLDSQQALSQPAQVSAEIRVRGEAIGTLSAVSEQGKSLSDEDKQIVQAVADRVALAIENVRLVEQTQQEARRNRVLAEAAQVVSQIGLDFEEGMARLLEVGSQAETYDRWWFGQIQPDGKTLLRVAAHFPAGSAAEPIERISTETDNTPIGLVARHGTPHAVNDRTDEVLSSTPRPLIDAFGKHIAMPVRAGADLFGVLLVGRDFNRSDIDQDDWQLVGALVSQLSVAAENRRLFGVVQRGQETLQSVLNSLPAGVVVVDALTRQIVLANAQVSIFFGIDSSGRGATSILLPGPVNPRSPEFAPIRVLDTGTSITSEEFTFNYPNGESRSFLVNAVPVTDANGIVTAAVAVFTDTSEIRDLEAELQQNLVETSTLYESAKQIAAEQDQTAILQTAVRHTHQYLRSGVVYGVLQNDENQVTLVYRGDNSAAQTTEIMLYTDPLPFSTEQLSQTAETHLSGSPSLSSYPLKARGHAIGWMVLVFSEDRVLDAHEHRIFSGIADQTAVALESARLARETSDSLRDTEMLYRASRAINNAESLQATAEVIRDQVLRLLPDRIDIFIMPGGELSDRVDWIVRYEATPRDARSTAIIDSGYLSDAELLAYPAMYLEDIDMATPTEISQLQHIPNGENIRAQISLPLRIKNASLGRVVISFFESRRISAKDRQFIQTLVEQAGVVMDNAILYQQTQENLNETQMMYKASRAIADASTNKDILHAIVNFAIPNDVTRGLLAVLLSETWTAPDASIEIAGDWSSGQVSASLEGLRFAASQFPGWSTFATPDLLYVDNIWATDRISDDDKAGFMTLDVSAFVVVPLTVSGRPVGALFLGSAEAREHGERELRLYSNFADQAAIAIENRNLLQKAESRARQLATSADVGRVATSTLDLNELLDQTVNLIKERFAYDHAQIFLITPDGKDAVLKSSTGEAGRQLLELHHKLAVGSESVIGRVTSQGELYNVYDTADSRHTHRPNPNLADTRSELAIPLIARGHIIGALDVQSNTPNAFRQDDERVLSTLADQIAVAIDNASLFDSNAQRLQEMQFLFNATRTAASSEIDVALTRITREILSNTRSDLAILLLLAEDGRRLNASYAARQGAEYIIPATLSLETPIIQEIAESRSPRLFDDGAEGTLYSADDVPGLHSLVLVPLFSGDLFLGVVGAASENRAHYNDSQVRLLETLVSTLTAIIQNARLLTDLQEANQRLREVDKLKSQFLANMSHELRTPLNSIIGFSRVILKGIDGPLNETQTQDLTTIHESGKHLLNLVNDILDQAKIEAGKMEIAPDYHNIEDLIKSVMSTAIGLVKDKPIRLHTEIQPDLPRVFADEFRTRQVLLNMLSNSSKFTKQGSITVSAYLITDEGRQMVQVNVADTGIGIAPENLRRVFAQFEQVDNSTARGAEGTGLGMPIAKALIEMQGGRIWLESTVGVGTTFSITIPIQPPETSVVIDQSDEEHIEPVSGAAAPQALPNELEAQVEQAIKQAEAPRSLQRIAVAIDDEAGMISLYRRYLAKTGFEVIGTTNPEEATDLIVNYQPNVILLDVNMPKKNGWDVLRTLKDLDETFEYPVIVCSIEDDKTRAFRLGAADYLVKPFLEEDLVAAIRRVELERHLPAVLLVSPVTEALARTRSALTARDDVMRLVDASDLEQALDMIESQRPDLVLFDLREPGFDVKQAVQTIRSRPEISGTRLLVIPGPDLSGDDLITLAAQNVQLETGVTDDMLLEFLRHQLNPNAGD